MLLSDLLDRPVLCDGTAVGKVIDARFTLTGRASGPLAQPQLLGLVVGRRRGAAFLGYERRTTNRPAVINRFFAWRQRRSFLVDWGDVLRVEGVVELSPDFTRWSAQV